MVNLSRFSGEPQNFRVPILASLQSVSSVALSCLTLRPHGLQHVRPPCPSPTPGACLQACPSSWCCHSMISFSVICSAPAFNLSHHQGLFQWVSSWHQVAKVLELKLQHRPSNEYSGLISFRRNWFDLLAGPRDSQESSPTTEFKSINSSAISSSLQYLMVSKLCLSYSGHWPHVTFEFEIWLVQINFKCKLHTRFQIISKEKTNAKYLTNSLLLVICWNDNLGYIGFLKTLMFHLLFLKPLLMWQLYKFKIHMWLIFMTCLFHLDSTFLDDLLIARCNFLTGPMGELD